MNKKLSLAVAGAVLAFGASAANAGITIPAGDWTVDIGGNVNAYYTHVNRDTSATINGASVPVTQPTDANTIGTGLLPSALGIGAKTRQNDLDIAFQFTFFTGTSSGTNSAGASNTLNIRQAYLTFGDASWGTIKAGRDLGIFGSDAILSDMTLLGVGVGAPAGGSSTLGRIGSGYVYADWKGQISYTSPNWNGFSFGAGIIEPWTNGAAGSTLEDMGYEGKVSYDFTSDTVTGKVWLSGITQRHATGTDFNGNPTNGYTAEGFDIGGKVAVAGFGLVGYYYDGKGLDSNIANNTAPFLGVGAGGLAYATGGLKSDDNGGYVQATYTIPGVGTKLGASWGTSKSDYSDVNGSLNVKNESWILGAYHPITKSLNLVAEYTNQKVKSDIATVGNTINGKADSDTVALGAILFF